MSTTMSGQQEQFSSAGSVQVHSNADLNAAKISIEEVDFF